ncbi:MAG: DUF2793 domain-containing protein [Alphaproteobacteria bacterium]|nr:DUF2793 domain-containing protein [Alphaproteobacteria bacterium]
MSDETPRLKLSQLASALEMSCETWNEALAQLDAIVDLCLLGQFVDTPPSAPADGDAWLVGGSPTGAWSGSAYKIATCLDGAWRFLAPFDGLRAYVAPTSAFIVYKDGAWTDWNSLISAHEVSLASAATCDLGAAGALFVEITGTAAISSFGGAANTLRFVRFAGALTLNHDAASLALLGGVSRVTAAGDLGLYTSDANGHWRERSYVRAATDPGNESAFAAYLSASTTNDQTGDGTSINPIICDGIVRQSGSEYDGSTGIYTAHTNGWRLFGGGVLLRNLSSAHTSVVAFILASGNYYRFARLNPGTARDSGGLLGLVSPPILVYMTAGQTAQMGTAVYNGTKTVGIYGGDSGFTYFHGCKMPWLPA